MEEPDKCSTWNIPLSFEIRSAVSRSMFHVEHFELCKVRQKSRPNCSIPTKYDSKVHALESGIAIDEFRHYSALKLSGFS